MKQLFLIVALATLVPFGTFAKGRGAVHPAPKGIKIGALGKDYVALSKPYSWSDANPAIGLSTTTALPAGVYRVKFEDDSGYYLPAPAKIGEKAMASIFTYDGGIYVRKDKADAFYLYKLDRNGKIAEPGQKLPWDFVRHLRQ